MFAIALGPCAPNLPLLSATDRLLIGNSPLFASIRQRLLLCFQHVAHSLLRSLRSCALGESPTRVVSSTSALFEKTTREGGGVLPRSVPGGARCFVAHSTSTARRSQIYCHSEERSDEESAVSGSLPMR